MLKFISVFQILFLYVNSYCQNTNLPNKQDSIRNKQDLCIEYDIEYIKYSETIFGKNVVKHTNYFSRQGDTITMYNWAINLIVIKKIREKILGNFTLNDETYAKGSALLLLLFDCEKSIFEIRIIRGITEEFDNELLQAVKKAEKDLIFICPTDCKTPIVTPFAIRL